MNKIWTKEKIFEAAKDTATPKEFENKNPGGYSAARKKGLLSELREKYWEKAVKPHGYWTEEKIFEIAKNFSYASDFKKKYPSAYTAAQRKGLLPKLKNNFWKTKYQRSSIFTKEYCFKIIKENNCKTRTDIQRTNATVYKKVLENNWFNELPNIVNQKNGDEKIYLVYKYEWVIDKITYVYIGITLMTRQEKRHQEHCSSNKSTVYRFAKDNNLLIPNMIIIKKNLSTIEACESEDRFIQRFKNKKSFIVINKAKTGIKSSSCGALKYGKLTEEYCYNIARTYTTIKELRENDISVYSKACRMGWKQQYFWLKDMHKPKGYWDNYENCYAAFVDSGSDLMTFREKYRTAYKYAVKNRFTFNWHKPKVSWNKVIWTREQLIKVCRQYNSRNELHVGNISAYRESKRTGIIDKIFPIKPTKEYGFWDDYNHCKEEAMKYPSRWAFGKNNGPAYQKCHKYGWIEEFFPKNV